MQRSKEEYLQLERIATDGRTTRAAAAQWRQKKAAAVVCSVKRETYGAVYHLACFLSVFMLCLFYYYIPDSHSSLHTTLIFNLKCFNRRDHTHTGTRGTGSQVVRGDRGDDHSPGWLLAWPP